MGMVKFTSGHLSWCPSLDLTLLHLRPWSKDRLESLSPIVRVGSAFQKACFGKSCTTHHQATRRWFRFAFSTLGLHCVYRCMLAFNSDRTFSMAMLVWVWEWSSASAVSCAASSASFLSNYLQRFRICLNLSQNTCLKASSDYLTWLLKRGKPGLCDLKRYKSVQRASLIVLIFKKVT